MKNLNKLNYFFVGMPPALAIVGILENSFLFLALLSTIITGAFQVIVGLKMITDEPKDKNLQIYLISVVLYFIGWEIVSQNIYHEVVNYILFIVPTILAIYLSIIIFNKAKL